MASQARCGASQTRTALPPGQQRVLASRRPGTDQPPKNSVRIAAHSWSARDSFLRTVCTKLETAGVDYVVLHRWERRNGRPDSDSDIDLAVDRGSLHVVDSLARQGSFGRLLQRIDYDIPWCRYYVVESQETNRNYRQIDVACDPWGLGRYGVSIQVALANAVDVGGIRVPSPAAQTLYLAVKRSMKGELHVGDAEQLADAFCQDPDGAASLLHDFLGFEGGRLARALQNNQSNLADELQAIRSVCLRSRRRPEIIAKRFLFGALRCAHRTRRPT